MTLEQEQKFLATRCDELEKNRLALRIARCNPKPILLTRLEVAQIEKGKFFVDSKERQKNGKPKKIPIKFLCITIAGKAWRITGKTNWQTLSELRDFASRLCTNNSLKEIERELTPFIRACEQSAKQAHEAIRDKLAMQQLLREDTSHEDKLLKKATKISRKTYRENYRKYKQDRDYSAQQSRFAFRRMMLDIY